MTRATLFLSLALFSGSASPANPPSVAPSTDATDRDRLEQLRSALDSVNSQELSVASIRSHIQEATSRLQDLQLTLDQNTQADVLVDEVARNYQWQGTQQSNAVTADLQTQRLSVDNTLVQLKSQLAGLRETLPAGFASSNQIRDLELQISALESQRLQVDWQLRAQELNFSDFLASLWQQAQAQKEVNRGDRAGLHSQIAEAKAELAYWKQQEAAVGDEAQRRERAQALQTQIQTLQTRMQQQQPTQ